MRSTYPNYLQEWRSKEVFGPRESKERGECLYNCVPNDLTFCKVQFERHNRTRQLNGNPEGLCFKNKLCYGTPKACVDCKVKCEGFSGGSFASTLPPRPAPKPTIAPAPTPTSALALTPESVSSLITCTTEDGKNCLLPFIILNGASSVLPPAPPPTSRLIPDSATCTTKDGKKCQFPFIYKGEKYDACPPDPVDPNENWCSTRTNGDGEHVGGGGHYGFCGNNCPLTR